MGRAARRRAGERSPGVRTATGLVVPAPAPAARVPVQRPEVVDVRTALRRVAADRDGAERRQAQLVARARADGLGWAEIGRLIGRTGQAVQMRYGRAGGTEPAARDDAASAGSLRP